MSYLRIFYYSCPDLKMSPKTLCINLDEIYSIENLKKKIASEIQISEENIQFENPPEKELKDLEDFTHFKIIVCSLQSDIDIFIPGIEQIQIKDCYKKKYIEVFEYLEKEGIFFSQSCIANDIQMFLSDKEIERDGYPFLSVKKYDILNVKFKRKVVTLNFLQYKFIVSENESFNSVEKLIKKIFPKERISILDSKEKNVDKLIAAENYHIQVEFFADFANIHNIYSVEYIYVSYLATVSDVQKLLAAKLSSQLKPENIILYDNDKKKLSIQKKL